PFVAGVLALAINYSAYESEIYRAGLLAVPTGQMEAARALGMSHIQALWYVIFPQAIRTVIPPVTNDFIMLLQDSSLVSMITIVELTRTYQCLAATHFNYFETGLIVAAFYLLLGFPFIRLARAFEKKFTYKIRRN
ncbi:MAG: amino acid ABC transporter permease, partial [bacterium]